MNNRIDGWRILGHSRLKPQGLIPHIKLVKVVGFTSLLFAGTTKE